MRISIGSDHGGYELKSFLVEELSKKGIDVEDCGCYGLSSVDYPVYCTCVAKSVQSKKSDFGVLICTTGIGMSIGANKFKGIRAALVTNIETARLSREHNNSNIIVLGQKFTLKTDALKYVEEFINSEFSGGRHERRVNMILEVEENER